MMGLLDSNIVITAGNSGSAELNGLLDDGPVSVSAITKVEVLGFHALVPATKAAFEIFFRNVRVFEVDPIVIEQAISRRQTRRMSLGDALIAATALVHKLALVTRNTRDFSWIAGRTLIDPDASD